MLLALYPWLLFAKLAAALVYAGGVTTSLVASSLEDRRRAVHRIASPALLFVWISGFGLAQAQGIALRELWLLGGLAGSFVSLAALIVGLHVPRRAWPATVASTALGLVLGLMVFKPTWAALR
jgi:hypothetical protein